MDSDVGNGRPATRGPVIFYSRSAVVTSNKSAVEKTAGGRMLPSDYQDKPTSGYACRTKAVAQNDLDPSSPR